MTPESLKEITDDQLNAIEKALRETLDNHKNTECPKCYAKPGLHCTTALSRHTGHHTQRIDHHYKLNKESNDDLMLVITEKNKRYFEKEKQASLKREQEEKERQEAQKAKKLKEQEELFNEIVTKHKTNTKKFILVAYYDYKRQYLVQEVKNAVSPLPGDEMSLDTLEKLVATEKFDITIAQNHRGQGSIFSYFPFGPQDPYALRLR